MLTTDINAKFEQETPFPEINDPDGILNWDSLIEIEKLTNYRISELQLMANLAISNIEEYVDLIEQTFKSDEIDICKKHVHKLKGVSAAFGAKKLSEHAILLESALNTEESKEEIIKKIYEATRVCCNTVSMLKERYFSPAQSTQASPTQASPTQTSSSKPTIFKRLTRLFNS